MFPLLYLLLDHHWKIFCICKTKTIDDRELWDASQTIRHVLNAVRIRYDMLLGEPCKPLEPLSCLIPHLITASYLQQRTDPTAQFKIHANELVRSTFPYYDEVRHTETPKFDYWHDGEEFWSLENLKTFPFNVLDYREDNEDVDLRILRYEDIKGPEAEADNPAAHDSEWSFLEDGLDVGGGSWSVDLWETMSRAC